MPPLDQPPDAKRIEYRVVHRAASKQKGISYMIVSNPTSEKRQEVVIAPHHYRFAIPANWKRYDEPTTTISPGKIEVQFVAPAKDGTVIIFIYEGRRLEQEGERFHQLLHKHAYATKFETLSPDQIKGLTDVLGELAGNNQYAETQKMLPVQFKITDARVVSINHNMVALQVDGEFSNEPHKGRKPESYWRNIYLDGTGDGKNVHEIQYMAPSKEAFAKSAWVFDQVLKTISW